MIGPLLFRSGGRSRKLLAIRLAVLAVLLLATYVFRVSGTALVEFRIARIVILVLLVGGVGWYSRRRERLNSATTTPDDEASLPPA
jgi:hypothetical protein